MHQLPELFLSTDSSFDFYLFFSIIQVYIKCHTFTITIMPYYICYTGIQGLNYPELPSRGILGNKETILFLVPIKNLGSLNWRSCSSSESLSSSLTAGVTLVTLFLVMSLTSSSVTTACSGSFSFSDKGNDSGKSMFRCRVRSFPVPSHRWTT